MPTLTIRPARPEDSHRLANLASLDSSKPLSGDVLIAEDGTHALAAIDVISGRLVADPFVRSAREVELLRTRAEQLRSPARHRGAGGRAFGGTLGFAR